MTLDYENTREEIQSYITGLIKNFCSDWVVSGIIRDENQIRFSSNKIDINKNWKDLRFQLFLSNKRRTLEMAITDLRKTAIKETLVYCKKLLDNAKRNSFYKKLPKGPFEYIDENIKIFDKSVLELEEKSIDIIQKAIEASLQQGAKRVAGSFFFGYTDTKLQTSEDLEGSYKKTNLNFRVRAFAEDMYATGEGLSVSTHLTKYFDPVGAAEEAGEICRMAVGGKKGTPGTYNIIIYPKVSTELQAPTPAIGMNTYIKKMGLSWLAGKKEGDKIGSDIVSAWDDGTIDYGLASAPFDDEGVPMKKTLLIENGIVKNYFTNTSLSRRNAESTGNAGITIPKPTNTVFNAGDCTLEELMEISEKPTLLITSTWYTRYQSYAPPGILSSLPKDGMFLVRKNGEILEPVRELRINSNHFHMLENTLAMGKKLKQVYTWLSTSNNPVFAPFMLISDIQMTTGTK
ncbi:MAG: hypothetical protein GF317_25155 [Candidatus Lokiarchaeota archaeon]|nr:hypothetical protein [Candidatus Lokiarchaeota archaeon]MBD3202648.1 hypothetical protein [Candidatus Lokiarchaeota archaeon]